MKTLKEVLITDRKKKPVNRYPWCLPRDKLVCPDSWKKVMGARY